MNQTAGRKNREQSCAYFVGCLLPFPKIDLPSPGVSIIRCHRCGKEAPYPPDKIIDSQDMPEIGTPKVRAVGLN